MRAACAASIEEHAGTLVESFRLAMALHPPRLPVTAESLAIYTQTVLQGGFVLSKARGDRAPLIEGLAHLKNYITLLFSKETLQ
jgi:TetR/AcrR family transcriptional repressor of nem operon